MTERGVRLSVIIPCLDEAAVVGRLLQSLQALRDGGHELILVDGGSSDTTRELARPLVDRLIVSSAGRALQMNAGAAAATGDVLWFLHADCQVPEGRLPKMIAVMQQEDIAWGRFDVRLSGQQPLLRLVGFMMNWRSRLSGIATGDQGIFIRRPIFLEIDGFPDLPLMEDIAVSRRLKRLARPACPRQRLITSSRRWERDGILKTIFLMWRLRLAFALGGDPVRLAARYRQCNSPTLES